MHHEKEHNHRIKIQDQMLSGDCRYSNSRNTIEHFQLRATLKHDFLFSPVSICNSLKTMVGLTMERPELPKFKTMQRALTAQRDKGWFLEKSFSFWVSKVGDSVHDMFYRNKNISWFCSSVKRIN